MSKQLWVIIGKEKYQMYMCTYELNFTYSDVKHYRHKNYFLLPWIANVPHSFLSHS